jgi:hypothetical protein
MKERGRNGMEEKEKEENRCRERRVIRENWKDEVGVE